jgi:hypothetical protein
MTYSLLFLSTGDISLNWNRTPATAIETAFISFGLILTGMAIGLVVDYSESAVEAAVEMQHETTSMAKKLEGRVEGQMGEVERRLASHPDTNTLILTSRI